MQLNGSSNRIKSPAVRLRSRQVRRHGAYARSACRNLDSDFFQRISLRDYTEVAPQVVLRHSTLTNLNRRSNRPRTPLRSMSRMRLRHRPHPRHCSQ